MPGHSSILVVDEAARRKFEAAWASQSAGPIEEYLPPRDSPTYLGTLEELVQIELEFTWGRRTAGSAPPPLVETYLARFSELDQPGITLRLLRQERRVRHKSGDHAPASEYVSRFPHLVTGAGELLEPDGATVDAADSLLAPAPGSDGESARMPELPGYEVLKVLGKGGMGIVLQARHRALKRLVAIKLPLNGSLSKSESDRFLREARSAASLRHPNICPIYEVGEHRNRPYIAMGFVEGPTLAGWHKQSNPSARECAEMVAKVARAVAYAHEHNTIHRDIKPGNVLIDSESRQPILTDFGLAKQVTPDQTVLTQDGTALGTPAYMSPEQAAGRMNQIGPASDVYSLGAMLYEMLCGEPVYSGSIGEILRKLQTETPTPLRKRAPRIHRDLETICMKALASEPHLRYPTAAALADDLDRFSGGEAITARREGVGRKAIRVFRRHPRQIVAYAAMLVLAFGAIFYFSQGSAKSREAARLVRQIDARLQNPDWNGAALADIDATIAKLAELDPQQAAIQKQRVASAMETTIDGLLRTPAFSDETQGRVEHLIALMSQRAPERRANALENLNRRRRTWETVFETSAPFANISSLSHPDCLHVTGNSLTFAPPDAGAKNAYTPIDVARGSSGNVQMHVVLAAGWIINKLPILVLDCPGNAPRQQYAPPGYAFMVGEDTDTQELTMVCMRNNIPLRVARMHPSPEALSTKNELRLSVMREGSRFTFQVNDLPAVAMQDMFPEQSHKEQFFSLYAQPQTAIRQIRILRQRSPITPSSLEKGDELFNAGKFSEAMTFYQQQAIESVGQAGQEARLKVGMCLFLLKRQEEAAQQFEQVLNEEGERWPALAGCHLLVIRSIQRRATDVDSVYRTLRGRFPQSLISEILPEYSRAQLLQDSNAQSFLGLSLFGRLTPQQVEDARQQREFARLFTGEPTYADLMLVRAYSLSNQPAKATEAAEDALDRPYILPFSRMLFEDYGALMCQQEKANEGLLRVNDALLDGEGRIKADRLSLLVVRARLHIATKELAEAEKDIEEFIKLSANGHERYETEALAGLIRGFLRQDRGDTAGAAADFRYASAPQYLVRHRLPANTDISTLIGGMNPTTALLIAGSMADDITDAELQSIINFTLERVGGSDDASQNRAAAGVLLFRSGVVKLPPSTLRDIWRTPRGKQTAREIVFRSLPLPELGRKTFVLGMYQYFLQGCTRTALATEEDNFLWEHSTVCCEVLRDHKLGKSQLLKITLAWNGTTNFLGWGGVEQSLEKPFRASMAYWLGKHYLFTGQKEAGQMFRTAADNSEADSTVHKLADVELQKLGNK